MEGFNVSLLTGQTNERLQSAKVATMEDKEDRINEDEVPTRTTPGSAIAVWKINKNGMKKPVMNQDLIF